MHHGESAEELLPLVYDELRAIAARHMQRERTDHTLQATALVNEAYTRLVDQKAVDWKGKTHFKAISAEMIRRVLVDHARRQTAAKRGGDAVRLPLGTTNQGLPYFVMEHVAGVPITEHCDRHKLSIDERLDLFMQVCEAV